MDGTFEYACSFLNQVRRTMEKAYPDFDAELDACGLNCPMPLLKAKLALNSLGSGDILKVTATDAGSQRDFRVFAELAGHDLLHEESVDGVFRYWLRKK